MMAKKLHRPDWFKMWLHHKPLIDAVPDDVAGKAIKAALVYFESGELTDLDPLSFAVFASLKADVDCAHADFARDTENGKLGGRPRKEKPPVTEGFRGLPTPTQREGEREREREREEDTEKMKGVLCAAQPPPRTKFSPPTVDDVRKYCTEQGYNIDADRFVDYYAATGWVVGRNKMKDWRAAVRNWNRKDHRNASKIELEQFHSPNWTIV